jgi:hypothetical protein
VLARVHLVATAVWSVLAGGAGAGFLARDALGLRQPLVALAWTLGAGLPLLALARARSNGPARGGSGNGSARGGSGRGQGPRSERGQATVEFAALVLLASLALGALAALGPRFDGRSFGGFLASRTLCAVERDCHRSDQALARAYGERDAALVREHAPNLVYERGERQLPVDWRRCRQPDCAVAPDEPNLDVHRSDAGERATVFTRVLRRDGRTYLQYWFYYPDSNTVVAHSDIAWEAAWSIPRLRRIVGRSPGYPGAHPDDWEAYVVRLDPDGSAWVRASSHGHWQSCKEADCRHEWTARTGWTRVSRGSHAGHIPLHRERRGMALPMPSPHVPPRTEPVQQPRGTPLLPGHDLEERVTTAEGLRLIPLETHDTDRYRPQDDDVAPPWEKDVYRDPESDES